MSGHLGTTASLTLTKHGENAACDVSIPHSSVLPRNSRIVIANKRRSLYHVGCDVIMRDGYCLSYTFRSRLEQITSNITHLWFSGCSTGEAQESQLGFRLAFLKPPFDELRPLNSKIAKSALNKRLHSDDLLARCCQALFGASVIM